VLFSLPYTLTGVFAFVKTRLDFFAKMYRQNRKTANVKKTPLPVMIGKDKSFFRKRFDFFPVRS